MQAYLVGGYVRDKLLGMDPADRDWVVVGETPASMLKAGYQLVGKEFPVFIHPHSREVYALARTGRGKGLVHDGRTVFTDQSVTLEQDLARRDLTINAMAMTPDGELIDPFGGSKDLANKILRHVGPGFADDPVRVLRIARFVARYDFVIAEETKALIQEMSESGLLDSLVPERVWAELEKALSGRNPDVFIETLRSLGALEKIFPEIDCHFGVPQTEKYHPEIDTGIHLLLALKVSARLSDDPMVRFGVLVHDFGKCLTEKVILPRHIGHEEAGVKVVERFCDRLLVPTKYRRFGRICSRYHLHMHRVFELKPRSLVDLFDNIGALKRPEDLERFILVCQSDAQGREGMQDSPYGQKDFVKQVFEIVVNVGSKDIAQEGVFGKVFGEKLYKKRIAAVKDKIDQIRQNHVKT